MAGIIGKKIGMTSIFDENGINVACTIVEAGPCVVTQLKTEGNDGYESIQIGFENKNLKKSIKSEIGHLKKSKTSPKKIYKEFPSFAISESDDEGNTTVKDIKVGDVLTASQLFNEGDFIDVSGKSKGRGFQGVVKRHGFRGVGDATHGQHNRMRAPGSIGAASYPARVFKGMRMAGRMGGKRVTYQNLKIMKILGDRNILLIRGAIPGPKNSYVEITK
ncbi:MAG: 50S ribosomal protein L3 [Bacteroidota bacterium]|nr:50S ribosomal protein L3 [Bacteroidota bacterium]